MDLKDSQRILNGAQITPEDYKYLYLIRYRRALQVTQMSYRRGLSDVEKSLSLKLHLIFWKSLEDLLLYCTSLQKQSCSGDIQGLYSLNNRTPCIGGKFSRRGGFGYRKNLITATEKTLTFTIERSSGDLYISKIKKNTLNQKLPPKDSIIHFTINIHQNIEIKGVYYGEKWT